MNQILSLILSLISTCLIFCSDEATIPDNNRTGSPQEILAVPIVIVNNKLFSPVYVSVGSTITNIDDANIEILPLESYSLEINSDVTIYSYIELDNSLILIKQEKKYSNNGNLQFLTLKRDLEKKKYSTKVFIEITNKTGGELIITSQDIELKTCREIYTRFSISKTENLKILTPVQSLIIQEEMLIGNLYSIVISEEGTQYEIEKITKLTISPNSIFCDTSAAGDVATITTTCHPYDANPNLYLEILSGEGEIRTAKIGKQFLIKGAGIIRIKLSSVISETELTFDLNM